MSIASIGYLTDTLQKDIYLPTDKVFRLGKAMIEDDHIIVTGLKEEPKESPLQVEKLMKDIL